MRRLASLFAALGVAACVYDGGGPPPMSPLAHDRSQPALALFEHVLTDYFARVGANTPTVCASLVPRPLTAEQEQALIARFDRLAPADRCQAAAGGWRDAITGEAAEVVQLYDFACGSETSCTGWVRAPGKPATRYTLRFADGAWHFDGDPRILAE